MAYLGEEIKKLGFGLMRLPKKDGQIDIEQTKEMVDLFMQKGFTYFDTAYVYDDGKSEEATKLALVDRYPRESFQLATKLPIWDRKSTPEEIKQRFYTSLERTQAGYFDFYLLHCLNKGNISIHEDYGTWEFLKELKQKGLIRHYGFSFHDSAEVLDGILTAHPDAEFVQLQINYIDWESEKIQSRKCYEVARKHNKPVIIMEPVKGGALATLPEDCAEIFKDIHPEASVASWAVRYAASLDNIVTVLSGMSNIEQMNDNLSYMENFQPLDKTERETVAKVTEKLEKIPQIPCTSCKYCIDGCPQNIPINEIFRTLNQFDKYNNINSVKWEYKNSVTREGKNGADACIGCGQCESICPQHIEIIDNLKRAAKIFG